MDEDRTAGTEDGRPGSSGTGTVVVLAGGERPHPRLALPAAELVVAADSGADDAVGLGTAVDVLVGDLDSVAETTRARLSHAGARIEAHPRDKDATDLELAVEVALAHRPSVLVVVGGHGGRLDHAWAVLGLLAATARHVDRLEAWMGAAQVAFAGPRGATAEMPARVGELVSLVAVAGDVHGVTTDGLRWPLEDAAIPGGSGWGMSNEAVTTPARITVDDGTLAVVRPHALSPEADEPHRVPR